MKKTRMIMMMTAALLAAVQFAACDSSLADIVAGQKAIDAEKQNAEILSWVFTISPDIYPGGINQDSRIITAVVPSAVVQGNTAIAAQVALSEGATIEPNPATAVSYPPKGVTYTVTSKGGFSQTYTVKVSGSSSIPGLTVDPPTAVELGKTLTAAATPAAQASAWQWTYDIGAGAVAIDGANAATYKAGSGSSAIVSGTLISVKCKIDNTFFTAGPVVVYTPTPIIPASPYIVAGGTITSLAGTGGTNYTAAVPASAGGPGGNTVSLDVKHATAVTINITKTATGSSDVTYTYTTDNWSTYTTVPGTQITIGQSDVQKGTAVTVILKAAYNGTEEFVTITLTPKYEVTFDLDTTNFAGAVWQTVDGGGYADIVKLITDPTFTTTSELPTDPDGSGISATPTFRAWNTQANQASDTTYDVDAVNPIDDNSTVYARWN